MKLLKKCGKQLNWKPKVTGKCDTCYKKSLRKIERPSYNQLLEEVEKLGWSATGRKYGVSDNSIRKWVKNYKKELEIA